MLLVALPQNFLATGVDATASCSERIVGILIEVDIIK